MLIHSELGVASALRSLMLGIRLLFTVIALVAFKGAEYNVYSEYIALVSFLVVISGVELYNYNQKISRDIEEYEELRATYYFLEFITITLISIIGYTYFNLSLILIIFAMSELFLMELIRHQNYIGRFKFAQFYNLIFRGLTPLIVVFLSYVFRFNVDNYFIILGTINFLGVIYFLDVKFKILKLAYIDVQDLIKQVLPLLAYVSFYRYCDLILREKVNALTIAEVEKNYVHLGITIIFILEGFIEQIFLQPVRNNLLKRKRYIFPKNFFFTTLFIFGILGCVHTRSPFDLLQVMIMYVVFRLVNGIYVILYMRFNSRKFYIYTFLEVILFLFVILYDLWFMLLCYILVKTLLIKKNLVHAPK